jgi:hypothetical protein
MDFRWLSIVKVIEGSIAFEKIHLEKSRTYPIQTLSAGLCLLQYVM